MRTTRAELAAQLLALIERIVDERVAARLAEVHVDFAAADTADASEFAVDEVRELAVARAAKIRRRRGGL